MRPSRGAAAPVHPRHGHGRLPKNSSPRQPLAAAFPSAPLLSLLPSKSRKRRRAVRPDLEQSLVHPPLRRLELGGVRARLPLALRCVQRRSLLLRQLRQGLRLPRKRLGRRGVALVGTPSRGGGRLLRALRRVAGRRLARPTRPGKIRIGSR